MGKMEEKGITQDGRRMTRDEKREEEERERGKMKRSLKEDPF